MRDRLDRGWIPWLNGVMSGHAVEINVEKCGVMHGRRKGVKRMEVKFYICWW